MAEAETRYGREPGSVRIMAVTKTVPPEKVNAAVAEGITLLGENRVQEYLSKKDQYDSSAEVHIIGHLQTNKVKYIINDVAMIQSVDSVKLAHEIDRLAEKNGLWSLPERYRSSKIFVSGVLWRYRLSARRKHSTRRCRSCLKGLKPLNCQTHSRISFLWVCREITRRR